MAGYGNSCERCRFCGFDLPQDSASVMAHYNNHWRQCNSIENVQNLSPCAYEPQLDIRIGPTPINPEDLEVSGYLEQTAFQYSPQTEPSNLSLTGTRCSPLNLTGRPKAESPLTSPLASPLPNDTHPSSQQQALNMNIGAQHHHHNLHSIGLHTDLNNQSYSTFSPGLFNSCSSSLSSQIISTMQLNESLDMSCHMDNEDLIGNNMARKKRKPDRVDVRCLVCNRIFYTKASFDEHSHLYHSKCDVTDNTNHTNYLMNNDPVDLNQSVQEVMNCTLVSKPYKCSICDQEFMYREELAEHANNHEASKPYRCELCGTGLSHISALRRHILSHGGHKPHICEICNRGFFQKCDLIRHYSTHGKKKDAQCNYCKKKYTSEYFLKSHKCKPPEEPKPFKCHICGNSCATNVAWSYHMWKHTKNPIFVPFQSNTDSNKAFSLTTNYVEKVTGATVGV